MATPDIQGPSLPIIPSADPPTQRAAAAGALARTYTEALARYERERREVDLKRLRGMAVQSGAAPSVAGS